MKANNLSAQQEDIFPRETFREITGNQTPSGELDGWEIFRGPLAGLLKYLASQRRLFELQTSGNCKRFEW